MAEVGLAEKGRYLALLTLSRQHPWHQSVDMDSPANEGAGVCINGTIHSKLITLNKMPLSPVQPTVQGKLVMREDGKPDGGAYAGIIMFGRKATSKASGLIRM